MNDYQKPIVIMFVFMIAIVAIFMIPQLVGTQTTGVCIYKGPAFYSTGLFGGTQSTGTPLRGIGIDAWHTGSFGVHTTDAAGSTDRTGCFTFKLAWGEKDYLSYSYNGTSYIDSVDAGTVLQDNLP